MTETSQGLNVMLEQGQTNQIRLYQHMRKDDIDETDVMATCDSGEEAGEEAEKKDEEPKEDKALNPESDDILSSGGALFGALTGKDPSIEEKPKPKKKALILAQLERAKKAKAEVAAKKKMEAEAMKKAEEAKKKAKAKKDAEDLKIAEDKAKREQEMLNSMIEEDNMAKEQDHSENDYFKIKSAPLSDQDQKETSLSETASTIVGKAKDTVFKGLLGSFAF